MKTVMRMRDLKVNDGFPSDIDRHHAVVVLIRNSTFLTALVLYTAKKTTNPSWEALPASINRKYKPGLYIIKPE